MSSIRERMDQLLQIKEETRMAIHLLQEKCEHEEVNVQPGSNTGNYDPTADSYWYDYICRSCDKRWREDQ